MLRTLYLGSRGGRFALYALFSALMAGYYGIWGGPQELSSLIYTTGVLESAEHRRGFGCKGGAERDSSYTLNVRAGNGALSHLELFENCGARFRPLLQEIAGNRIAVWSDDVGNVYRIVSADRVVVDKRGNGNQRLQVVYGIIAFAVFGVITVNRYRQVRSAAPAQTPGGTKPRS